MPPLQMHTIVRQPLMPNCTGSITCVPMGVEPIEFTWYGVGTGASHQPVKTSASGREAVDISPGRYRVVATDAASQSADMTIEVCAQFTDGVIANAYEVQHCSTSISRDGSVRLSFEGIVASQWRFLWSNGMMTATPELRDVPCGHYAAVAVIPTGVSKAPIMIHRCHAAHVKVSGGDVLP